MGEPKKKKNMEEGLGLKRQPVIQEGLMNNQRVKTGDSSIVVLSILNQNGQNAEGYGDEEHRVFKHRQVKRYTPHLKAGVHIEKSSTR